MKHSINCVKCGKEVVKMYGYKDLCNLCYTVSLNLTERGTLELKKLRGELKQIKSTLKTLRTTLSNHRLSLKTAARNNEKLKATNNELESFFAVTFKEIGKEQS
jgi:NMD protein affecting ribosome stability and mRNA decay